MRSPFFQALVQSLEDAVIVINEAGFIEYANPATEKLLGHGQKKLIGQKVNVLMPPEHAREHDLYIARYLCTGQASIIGRDRHVAARHANGDLVDVMLSVTTVDAGDGQPRFIGRLRDIRTQLAYERRLEQLAFCDELTGLPNGVALRERLERPGGANVLAIVDVAHFQRLNDGLGFAAGDALLSALAARLRQHLPPSCTLYRWTGDEFVLLSDDATRRPHHWTQTLSAWMAAVTQQSFIVNDHRILLGLRCGFVLRRHPDEKGETLISAADWALHEAKRRPPPAVVEYGTLLKDACHSPIEWRYEVEQALSRREFVAFLQPQVDRDGRPIGAELLARWQHPSRGILQPAQFWSAVEALGMANTLGLYMIHVALDIAKRWQADEQLKNLRLSFNISPSLFRCDDLIDHLSHRLPPNIENGKLCIEITEEAVFDEPERALERARQLRSMGLELSLDDFGTGYSSLMRLLELPLNEIKIDRYFIHRMRESSTACAVLEAAFVMAKALGVRCVAEGVEDQSQVTRLSAMGLGIFQGFAFGHAMPVDDFESWARNTMPRPQAGK